MRALALQLGHVGDDVLALLELALGGEGLVLGDELAHADAEEGALVGHVALDDEGLHADLAQLGHEGVGLGAFGAMADLTHAGDRPPTAHLAAVCRAVYSSYLSVDVDRGEDVVLDQPLGDEDRVLSVFVCTPKKMGSGALIMNSDGEVVELKKGVPVKLSLSFSETMIVL